MIIKSKKLKMKRICLINQFANTPDLPGHTRQYEIALGLIKEG